MINKERLLSVEVETRRNIGVGLLIINAGRKIYTVRVLTESVDTERVPGQIAVSTEKSKIGGESLQSNLLGALGEFCSDRDMAVLKEHLFMVGSPRITPVDLDGKPLSCSLVTLVCDVDIHPMPAHREEVLPNGWMDLLDILKLPNLRSLSRQILDVVSSEGLVETGIKQFQNPAIRIPILGGFGSGVSFDAFVHRRNMLPDSYVSKNGKNGANGHI